MDNIHGDKRKLHGQKRNFKVGAITLGSRRNFVLAFRGINIASHTLIHTRTGKGGNSKQSTSRNFAFRQINVHNFKRRAPIGAEETG